MKKNLFWALCLSCIVLFACKKANETAHYENTEMKNSQPLAVNYNKTMAALRKTIDDKFSPVYYLSKAIPAFEKAVFIESKNAYIIPLKLKQSITNETDNKVYAFAVYNKFDDVLKSQFCMIRNQNNNLDEGQAIENVKHYISNQSSQPSAANNNMAVIPMINGSKQVESRHGLVVKEKISNGKESNNGYQAEDCQANGGSMVTIDWYYQVWVNGNLVYEEYLFTTQECWAGGGGGGGGGGNPTNCQQLINDYASLGSSVEQIISHTENVQPNTATVYHDWMIYKAVTWGIISREKVVFYRDSPNKPWKRCEYTHLGDSPTGLTLGGNRTYSIQYIHPTDYAISCKVEIGFSVTSSLVCQGSPASVTTAHISTSLIKAPLSHVIYE